VQDVIRAHKAGDWTVRDGVVTVGGHELREGEYTLELVAADDQASTGLPDRGGVVALDVEVTDDLEREGRARDLVRLVQQARRDAGLDVSDRIVLTVTADDSWLDALTVHRDLVARETLATAVDAVRAEAPGGEPQIAVAVAGESGTRA
jgi:isoleucyl-tRNA synthetase